jgi:hypothetical protein
MLGFDSSPPKKLQTGNRNHKMKYLVTFFLCAGVCLAQKSITPERAEKLKTVRSLFVEGNNDAAVKIREEIEKGKTCFILSLKQSDADATFAITSDSQLQADLLPVRDAIVSGNLTNQTGELLWSNSKRFDGAPFMNAGKTAGKELILMLKRQVCEGKKK